MHLQTTIIFNKSELAEFVHEVAHARSRGSDHPRQNFLADLGNDEFLLAFLAKVRQQKQNARQSLFTGIKELVHQVLFKSNIAQKQVGGEELREFRVRVQQTHHGFLVDAQDGGILRRRGG